MRILKYTLYEQASRIVSSVWYSKEIGRKLSSNIWLAFSVWLCIFYFCISQTQQQGPLPTNKRPGVWMSLLCTKMSKRPWSNSVSHHQLSLGEHCLPISWIYISLHLHQKFKNYNGVSTSKLLTFNLRGSW